MRSAAASPRKACTPPDHTHLQYNRGRALAAALAPLVDHQVPLGILLPGQPLGPRKVLEPCQHALLPAGGARDRSKVSEVAENGRGLERARLGDGGRGRSGSSGHNGGRARARGGAQRGAGAEAGAQGLQVSEARSSWRWYTAWRALPPLYSRERASDRWHLHTVACQRPLSTRGIAPVLPAFHWAAAPGWRARAAGVRSGLQHCEAVGSSAVADCMMGRPQAPLAKRPGRGEAAASQGHAQTHALRLAPAPAAAALL